MRSVVEPTRVPSQPMVWIRSSNGLLAGVFLLLLFLYLLFPSQQYDKDVLPELGRINRLDYTSPDPAHMLYVLLGIPFYKAYIILGGSGDALRVMQILNAIFGASALAVFWLILQTIGVEEWAGTIISLACGLSYAMWTHTVDAFFIIPATFFALVSLWLALQLASQDPFKSWPIMIGLPSVLAAATLLYQTNLLIIPSLIAASWPNHGLSRRWIAGWGILLALFTLIAGTVWLYQGVQFGHTPNLSQTLTWLISQHGGVSNGLWRRDNPIVSTTLVAWLATWLPVYEGMRLRDALRGQYDLIHLPGQLALVFLFLFVAFSGAMLLNTVKQGIAKRQLRIWTTCLLWFAIPGAAVLWFDRAEVKLWLIPFFAVWLFLALGLSQGARSSRAGLLYQVSLVLSIGMLVTMATANFLLAIWPNHHNEAVDVAKARYAISVIRPNDLLISASFDWTQDVTYLCQDCQVLNMVAMAQQADLGLVPQALFSRMEATWEQKGNVYIVDYFNPSATSIWSSWITRYTGVSEQDFSTFRKEIAWQVYSDRVWKLTKP